MPDILSILEEEGLQRLARSVDDVAELIDATPWSSDFSWSQLKMLAKYVQVFLAPDGEKIVREGDHENYLCVVVDGRVRVQKSDCCDRPKVIAILGPGKTLGEMSLLDEADFEVMKREHPALALQVVLKIAELLSQRLRSTSGRLVDHLE